jgi:hypothetical protein
VIVTGFDGGEEEEGKKNGKLPFWPSQVLKVNDTFA